MGTNKTIEQRLYKKSKNLLPKKVAKKIRAKVKHRLSLGVEKFNQEMPTDYYKAKEITEEIIDAQIYSSALSINLEEIMAKLESVEASLNTTSRANEQLIEELWKREKKNGELKDTLEWYAKESRYEPKVKTHESHWFKPFVTPGIVYDRGKKAREVLGYED